MSVDNRPLRERAPLQASIGEEDSVTKSIDWRHMEVPRPHQIRGIARIQPPCTGSSIVPSCPRLAPKGWREPPELRPSPPWQPHAAEKHAADRNPVDKSAAERSVADRKVPSAQRHSSFVRGSTCPPTMRRGFVEDQELVRRPSREDRDETTASRRLAQRGAAPAHGPTDLDPSGVPAPVARHEQRDLPGDKMPPPVRRRRARSEHSGAARIQRVGKLLLQPKLQEPGLMGIQAYQTPGR